MKRFAVYESELPIMRRPLMQLEEPTTGDMDDYRILDPVIRSEAYGERHFTNWKAVSDHYNTVIEQARIDIGITKKVIDNYLDKNLNTPYVSINEKGEVIRARGYADVLLKAATELDGSLDGPSQLGYYTAGSPGPEVELTDDERRLLGFTNSYGKLTHQLYLKDMTEREWAALRAVRQIKWTVEQWKKHIAGKKEWIDRQKKLLERLRKTYEVTGGIKAVANIPFGIANDGKVVDTRRGIVMFDSPQGHLEATVVLDTEQAEAFGGLAENVMVDVTFGYSEMTNGPLDITSVLIGKDIKNKPAVVGLCRSSDMKPHVISAPGMTLYEDQFGYSINVTEVVTASIDKTRHFFDVPDTSTGYVYTFSGFQNAVLDAGYTAIQYEWAATSMGRPHTVVAVNAVGARALAGVPGMARRRKEDLEFGSAGRTIVEPYLNE